MLLNLDAMPLATDWEDLNALWADMMRFAKENPNHLFVCADDPGMNHSPPRVGRLGWTAFLEWTPCSDCGGKGFFRVNGVEREDCTACKGVGKIPPVGGEQAKGWTITLSNMKKSLPPQEPAWVTASGRQDMLKALRD